MAEKIVIEIYKNKAPDELTKLIAAPDSKLETGSAAALEAAIAGAFLSRAAAITAAHAEGERIDYIVRNAEKIRAYMVHLIDEDVKGRAPMNKHEADGDARKLEAARQVAVSIPSEIVNMMGKCFELLRELADICPQEGKHYLREAAETALCAMKCSISYIMEVSSKCRDETYRFVARRENEMTLEQYSAVYEEILSIV